MKFVSILVRELQTVIFLTCGALLIVTLSMPWIQATLLSFMGMRLGLDADGWAIIDGEMSWIGATGPVLVLISGILMIACGLVALILPRIAEDSKEVIEYIGKGVRVVPVVAIVGVIFFYIDAKDFEGCGYVPDEWIGYAVWVVGVVSVVGAIVGISTPKSVMTRIDREAVIPLGSTSRTPESKRSIRRELLEREEETEKVDEESDSAKDHFDRAVDYAGQGDTHLAIGAYNDAIEADGNFARAYFNRGAIYDSLGRTNEARDDFQKVIEISEDPDLVSIARKRIERLDQLT